MSLYFVFQLLRKRVKNKQPSIFKHFRIYIVGRILKANKKHACSIKRQVIIVILSTLLGAVAITSETLSNNMQVPGVYRPFKKGSNGIFWEPALSSNLILFPSASVRAQCFCFALFITAGGFLGVMLRQCAFAYVEPVCFHCYFSFRQFRFELFQCCICFSHFHETT